MLPIGALVAGYRVERVLGAGGMGTVYLVANPELPRRDALKVLFTELSCDDQFRFRFIREADVASRLSHPNIVTIYRRGQTEDGQLWIAMQYVDGIDADEVMRRGLMTPDRAVYITAEIGKALDYAHRHQVIHRDVKPANFLLEDPSDPAGRVLLADFGIARALDDVGLTTTGSMVTTVAYAAPEVLAGGRVDGRADLYSLGCTLFRMLTGKAPFAGAHGAPAIMLAHLSEPPPRVTDHVGWLPPALDAVIATAMAKDPARRFRTAADLAAAARAALHTAAPGPTAAIPASERSVFHAAPTQMSPHPPGTQPWTPPPRAHRRGKIAAAVAGIVVLVAAGIAAVLLTSGKDTAEPTAQSEPTTTTTTRSGPPPPTVSPAELDGLLLPVPQLTNLTGAPSLTPYGSLASPADDASMIDEKQCLSAWAPAQRIVYSDAGWVAARNQGLQDSPSIPTYRVIQAVLTLPSAAAAEQLLTTQADQWTRCAGTRITVNYPQPPTPQRWTFGEVAKTDIVVSIPYVMESGAGMSCQRAMSARNNVVVDVLVCRPDVGNQGVDVAEAIRAKIPG